MKKYFILFILIYLTIAPHAYGADITNTGFIPGQIWYSKDSFVEGETIKIYTALWNSGDSSLSAKVEFYDKKTILGSRDVVVNPLQIKDVSISWKVTSGDHFISAKIISPSITTDGKKKIVSVDNNTTEVSSKFIPVMVKRVDGTPATSGDVIKNQIDKATSSIDDIVPISISTPVAKKASLVDGFRANTFEKIFESKTETRNRIDEIKKIEEESSIINSSIFYNKSGVEDATEEPIAYLKLFFLSALAFIFGSKIVFYLVIALIIYLISRSIYRKVRWG